MADISKVTASDGTTYDLKDATARSGIANLATVASTGSYDDLSNTPIEVVYCKATSILPTASGGTVKAVFTDIPLKYLDQDNVIFVLAFQNTISNTGVLNELVVNDFYGTNLVDYYVGIGINISQGAQFTYLNGVYGSYKIHDGETVVFKRVTLSAYGEDYERYLVLGVFPKYAEIDYNSLINTPTLATVATSGAYSDLSGTPDLSTKMDKLNPTGTGAFSLNRKANTTIGNYSTAEGYNCTASGKYSHAEGDGT